MSAHQFSDRPFAVGSLFGIRSFRVAADGTTGYGMLTGVVHQAKWAAGVNEGECRSQRRALADANAKYSAACAEMQWTIEKMGAAMRGKVLLKKRPKPPEPKPMPEHTIGELGCTCGYYAYFRNGYNPHHHPGNILGIIEGFGVMTVGTRGFRCSKARIRALIVEDPAHSYTLAMVRPNYPGVPVFASIDEALAEFPLTVPEGTPEPAAADMAAPLYMPGGYVTFTMTVDTSGRFRR